MKPTTTAVTLYLTNAIENSGRTQQQIADICGFSRPTMVSMMKTGATKVPFDKIRPLARALRVEVAELARVVIGEYHPDLLKLMEEMAREG